MAIRYTKQIRQYDCGPTALANMLKWAGHKFSYKKYYEDFGDWVAVDTDFGTMTDIFRKKMEQVTIFDVVHKKDPTFNNLKKHLKTGGCIIWMAPTSEGYYHFSLIIGDTGFGFKIVNFSSQKTVMNYSYKIIRKYLTVYSECWLVKKI